MAVLDRELIFMSLEEKLKMGRLERWKNFKKKYPKGQDGQSYWPIVFTDQNPALERGAPETSLILAGCEPNSYIGYLDYMHYGPNRFDKKDSCQPVRVAGCDAEFRIMAALNALEKANNA